MILLKIQNQSSRFTPAECKIASCVLSNPQAAMGMTAAQLAEKCSVAPSAIIRFCKSIGLSGFSELKIRLAQESVSREKTDELPSPPSGEGAEGVARRVFQSGMQTLKNTMDMLDVKKLEEMADTLSLAKRIFIFGVGTSSVVASDAQYRLAQLGLDAHCCTDILFMNVTAVNLPRMMRCFAFPTAGRPRRWSAPCAMQKKAAPIPWPSPASLPAFSIGKAGSPFPFSPMKSIIRWRRFLRGWPISA